ncbi:Non-specific DNA-binding protein Dps [Salinisphaera sp. LB1]|nr:Non-specific DNA-binding protein Dps [Salinisphaera sp. LB1]
MVNSPRTQNTMSHADMNQTTKDDEAGSLPARSETAPQLMQHLYADMEHLFPGTGATVDPAATPNATHGGGPDANPAKRSENLDPGAEESQCKRRAEISKLLNQSLADCIDLERQAIQAIWNIKGANAIALKTWLKEINKTAALESERIAKRITELGGMAEATVSAVAARSGLSEYSLAIGRSEGQALAVSAALDVFVESLAEDIITLSEQNDVRSERILRETAQALRNV